VSDTPVPRPRNSTYGPAGPPYALVSVLGERRLLVLDHEITIGRGRNCDLRIADNPMDDHVSRLAATLRALEDCVLIRNESTTKQIALRPLSREAGERWPLTGITAIHRFGKIAPGGNIVLVVTASVHRAAAFEAAAFLMDYLKSRAPFWKKEHRVDGTQGAWVDAKTSDDKAAERWRHG